MPENCNIWAEVDFGRGSVDIRCTETGEHENHKCNVIFVIPEESKTDKEINGFNHRNVFEENNDEQLG